MEMCHNARMSLKCFCLLFFNSLSFSLHGLLLKEMDSGRGSQRLRDCVALSVLPDDIALHCGSTRFNCFAVFCSEHDG